MAASGPWAVLSPSRTLCAAQSQPYKLLDAFSKAFTVLPKNFTPPMGCCINGEKGE